MPLEPGRQPHIRITRLMSVDRLSYAATFRVQRKYQRHFTADNSSETVNGMGPCNKDTEVKGGTHCATSLQQSPEFS